MGGDRGWPGQGAPQETKPGPGSRKGWTEEDAHRPRHNLDGWRGPSVRRRAGNPGRGRGGAHYRTRVNSASFVPTAARARARAAPRIVCALRPRCDEWAASAGATAATWVPRANGDTVWLFRELRAIQRGAEGVSSRTRKSSRNPDDNDHYFISR